MEAAIVTVGDELLAGDIENTNASWIASQVTDRGVAVREIITVPDEVEVIERHVRRVSDLFDAVIVTGGIGGTPDDMTMEGVANAFGVDLVENDRARRDVEATLAEILKRRSRLDLNIPAEASIPAGGEPLLNTEGISPGCVIENVFVLPGIPREMKVMFEDIADEFTGNMYSRTLLTSQAESNIVGILTTVRDEFDVAIGCYPDPDRGPKRIKVRATDEQRLESAFAHLQEQLDVEDVLS